MPRPTWLPPDGTFKKIFVALLLVIYESVFILCIPQIWVRELFTQLRLLIKIKQNENKNKKQVPSAHLRPLVITLKIIPFDTWTAPFAGRTAYKKQLIHIRLPLKHFGLSFIVSLLSACIFQGNGELDAIWIGFFRFLLFIFNDIDTTAIGKIQGDGRKFLDLLKRYFGSQISSHSLNEIHIYRLKPK